ncbi:hypothetical protein RND81_06G066900 [Saponaria officinalis]|uniref:Reverse transcriptase RNase H-like domain-containing protein n=1 Tax=Saponaria officinalis TaxID=3572 RepID=A0AAW1K4B2_SAPOF
MPPQKELPLSLYLTTTTTAMGAILAPKVNGEGRAIYYISKNFQHYETRYTPVEKSCLALVWASQRFRHYNSAHPTKVYSKMDQLKYFFEKLVLNGRMTRLDFATSRVRLQIRSTKDYQRESGLRFPSRKCNPQGFHHRYHVPPRRRKIQHSQ